MAKRVFITGAAGLVGQNVIASLSGPEVDIVGVDKHGRNLKILRELHPEVTLIEADLAERGAWEAEVSACDCLIMLHAQIGGLNRSEFERNNLIATERVLEASEVGNGAYLVHVSSSVVNSTARDFYTETKTAQEALVSACAPRHVILRPTLMFGWFDRKHLGWLKRFMEKTPVFPIPGDGRFQRQPLFAGDFANIIASCIQSEITGVYDISGLETITYVDLIRLIKTVNKLKTPIVNIPLGLFEAILELYAVFDKNPPFSSSQLKALVTPDLFDVIDWPKIFKVHPTPLREALEKTFLDPLYSNIILQY